MNVFVAGGSGTIGIPLVRALVAEGHHVTALTRSTSRQGELRALGASVAVADALNRDSLIAAVVAARPTHVIHQLTALPKGGARRASDLRGDEPTAHRWHPESFGGGNQSRRPTIPRRLVCPTFRSGCRRPISR